MSMYNDFIFEIKADHPSAQISYSSGKATASRVFITECQNAEELALRLMGKFFQTFPDTEYLSPILPAPFPFSTTGPQGQLSLVASGFSIVPVSGCCFNTEHYGDASATELTTELNDPVDFGQLEKYYYVDREEDTDNSECLCKVTVEYEENPCDCMEWDSLASSWIAHDEILPGTCLSVERNPAYEMFTLPNTQLIWVDMPGTTEEEQAERRLKADSYAYKVIPKADIIVHWHNVPVAFLCSIETHLTLFRGKVNDLAWGDSLRCDLPPVSENSCGCSQFEAETILFVDWQEDRTKRTQSFYGFQGTEANMNTTTLKLFFKQKRIEKHNTSSYSDSDVCPDENDIVYGWNHLFLDREYGVDEWMRVAVEGTEEPLFKLKSFSDIFYPEI